jgi:hypothetical protein
MPRKRLLIPSTPATRQPLTRLLESFVPPARRRQTYCLRSTPCQAIPRCLRLRFPVFSETLFPHAPRSGQPFGFHPTLCPAAAVLSRRFPLSPHRSTSFSLVRLPLFSPSRSARTPAVSESFPFAVLWPLLTSRNSAAHHCTGSGFFFFDRPCETSPGKSR